MEKFEIIKAKAAPLPIVNIDTDMIIPKQFLKTIKRSGLGKSLFFEMRYDNDGNEITDFVLNQPEYRDARILVAGDNFGCGSSREHAPWALLDFGIKSIISTSFADIFYNNCFKNGILPIMLKADEVETLMEDVKDLEKAELEINLPEQKIIRANGEFFEFEIDAFRKKCLLEGLDDIGLTMLKEAEISDYEKLVATSRPWV